MAVPATLPDPNSKSCSSPASQGESDPLPEFASLRIGPAPKLASPFVTPNTSDMDSRSDSSLEPGELSDHILKDVPGNPSVHSGEHDIEDVPYSSHPSNENSAAVARHDAFSNLVKLPQNGIKKSASAGDVASHLIKSDTSVISRANCVARLQAAKIRSPGTLPRMTPTDKPPADNCSGDCHGKGYQRHIEVDAAPEPQDEVIENGQESKGADREKELIPTEPHELADAQMSEHSDFEMSRDQGAANATISDTDNSSLSQDDHVPRGTTQDERAETSIHAEEGAQHEDRNSAVEHIVVESNITPSTASHASEDDTVEGVHDINPAAPAQVPATESAARNGLQQSWPTPSPRPANGLQASRQFTSNGYNNRTPDGPRSYRQPCQPYHQQPYARTDDIRDQLKQMQTQLMATREKLDQEKTLNKTMRREIEAEVQKNSGTAIREMIDHLFRKQVDVAGESAKLNVKAEMLNHREQLCTQQEEFLALGQRRLRYQLDQNGGHHLSNMELDNAREQGRLAALYQHQLRHLELDAIERQLRCRETNLRLNGKHYKMQIRYDLEAELRATVEPELEARISEAEYEHGFEAGKIAGQQESKDEVHHAGFLEGYKACSESQELVAKMRAGKLAANSPQLDFLTDPEHPRNPFNLGLRMAQLHASRTTRESSQPPSIDDTPQINGSAPETPRRQINGTTSYINGNTPQTNGDGPRPRQRTLLRYEMSDDETVTDERSPRERPDKRRPDVIAHAQDERINLIDLY